VVIDGRAPARLAGRFNPVNMSAFEARTCTYQGDASIGPLMRNCGKGSSKDCRTRDRPGDRQFSRKAKVPRNARMSRTTRECDRDGSVRPKQDGSTRARTMTPILPFQFM
jgi:hypothetical protein